MELKPCPFCGGEVDPAGWLAAEGVRGPECMGCGATAYSVEAWEARVGQEIVYEAPEAELYAIPLGANPLQTFEYYVAHPNLFRTLAHRLAEFAIYVKVSCKMSEAPMEAGSIGPDVASASMLLASMAAFVEEAPDDE